MSYVENRAYCVPSILAGGCADLSFAVDRTALIAAVSRLLDVPVDAIQIDRESERDYSKVAVVSVSLPSGKRRYFAKQSADSLARQQVIFEKAQRLALPFIKKTNSYFDSGTNILLQDFFSGLTLEKLILAGPYLLNPGKQKYIRDLFQQVGQWLRAFHEIEASRGDCERDFRTYFDKRAKRLLPVLGYDCRGRLPQDLGLHNVPLALSHGDFTPQNIMFDQNGYMTVVDCGITEWERMSPCWDVVSLEAGVERVLRKSLSVQLMAFPCRADDLIAAFRMGYGHALERNETFKLFEAMRHMSFMLTDTSRVGRSAWHYRSFDNSLKSAAALKTAQ